MITQINCLLNGKAKFPVFLTLASRFHTATANTLGEVNVLELIQIKNSQILKFLNFLHLSYFF